ncbi:MAG: hypothetical protein WDA71_13510 [Actinomycetota bacterium]
MSAWIRDRWGDFVNLEGLQKLTVLQNPEDTRRFDVWAWLPAGAENLAWFKSKEEATAYVNRIIEAMKAAGEVVIEA